MVEISEEIVEEEENYVKKVDETTTQSENSDGWQKLMGDDLQLKVIDSQPLLAGKDPEEIQPQDAVLVDFIARYAETKDTVDGPIFQEAKGWLIVVGDGDVVPALEMGIRFLMSGQTGRIWSHSKYSLGPGIRTYKPSSSGTNKDIEETYTLPPNSSVIYEVKVHQKVMDTSRLNPYFTIQKALTRKNIANDVYQNEWKVQTKAVTETKQNDSVPQDLVNESGDDEADVTMAMSRAVRLYQKAANDMETLLQGTYFQQVEENHPQRHQARNLMLDCLNNIVAVHLRSEEYHKAKQAAVQVLQQDSKNLKALLRAAKAAMLDPASTMEEAEAALTAAEKEIVYKDVKEEKELKKLRQQFKRKQQEYKKKTKEMFGNKLKSPTPQQPTTEKAGDSQETQNDGKEEVKESVDGSESLETMDKSPPQRLSSVLDDDDAPFWKSQLVSVVVQLSIFVGLCLLARWFVQHRTFMHSVWENDPNIQTEESTSNDEF